MAKAFSNRRAAGKQLADKLSAYKDRRDVIVLALPRGGVPVGYEVAAALHAPLDLMLVRKLGVPGEEELAMGAIALPAVTVFNQDVIRNLAIHWEIIQQIISEETRELERRNDLYRAGARSPVLRGKTVILIDDGVATGANMQAAIGAIAQEQAARIIVAIPVAPEPVLAALRMQVDEVVCLKAPKLFLAVGQAYENFNPVEDEEVLTLLAQARQRPAKPMGGK